MPAVTQPHSWMLPLSPAPLVGIWVTALGAVMEVRGFPAVTGASSGFKVEKCVVGHVLLWLCRDPQAAGAGLNGSIEWSLRPGRDGVK